MRLLPILPIVLLVTQALHAQERSFDDVRKMRLSNAGSIQENNQLVGYYAFFMYDKVDKNTNAYHLEILDDNMNEAGHIRMKKPKTTTLTEMVYNGDVFALLFMDQKEKDVRLETYDRQGKKKGSKSFKDAFKWEMYRMQMDGVQPGSESGEVNQSIFPLGNTGFVKQMVMKKDKITWELHAFGSDMAKKWVYAPKPSGMIEVCNMVWASEDHILCTVFKQNNRMDKPDHSYAVLIDAKTGKRLFEKKMTDMGQNLSILNAYVDAEKNRVMAVGEYYAAKDNMFTGKSIGLYVAEVELSGDIVRLARSDWQKDVKPHLPGSTGEEEVGYLHFHRVMKAADGGHWLVGERFRKTVSAFGAAAMVLSRGGSGTAAFGLTIEDMVLVKLAPDLSIADIRTIGKGRSRVVMPSGAAYWSPMLMARYVSMMGGFDYAFTITDPAQDRFFSTFVDYDRSKGEDGEKVGRYVGTVVHDKGNISVDKLPIRTEATFYSIYPAKAGHIALMEYFKKEKRLSFRLEKVNF